MTRKEAERQEAIEKLRGWISPGDTVYTVLRHVSRSGMQREIGVVLLDCKDGQNIDLHPNYAVGTALGERIGKRDGVIVGGCGMDMGFHLVYNLSYVLFPKGFGCIGEKCPSNDHFNGDRDYTPHQDHATSADHVCATNPETCTARKHWHADGGYALRQRWL